eukprot:700280-Alexandrium_andersonii.AAC.1
MQTMMPGWSSGFGDQKTSRGAPALEPEGAARAAWARASSSRRCVSSSWRARWAACSSRHR